MITLLMALGQIVSHPRRSGPREPLVVFRYSRLPNGTYREEVL